MGIGKPGISSYDMFATGHAIRQELRTMGGNLLGLNSTLMKLSNGDDNSRASLDSRIGAREVSNVSKRKIGHTASSTSGGLGPTSTAARSANLLGNPYMRRYEGPASNGRHNFGLDGSPDIGEYYDVYESENNHLRFLDDTIGRDLFGYTHLENAAIERSGDATEDNIYLRSTYGIFTDSTFPFDQHDIEVFENGPRRYNPSDPYVLKPLETELVRRTLGGNVQGFRDRFEAVVDGREQYKGSLLEMWDFMGSHYYLNILNGVAEHGIYVENYENEPRNRVSVYDRDDIPQSDYVYFMDVDTVSPDRDIKGLLGKTNRMFYEGKIRSLANRFATLTEHDEGVPGFLNTATDHLYGLSRGRNLRKLNLTNENGYPNPYCRVWTTHYQYSKYKNLIRGKWKDDADNSGERHLTLHGGDQLMRPNKGYERLKNFTSIDTENGRPIFAPYYVNDRDTLEKDSIKKCMFSIENLAWKDIIPDSTLIRRNNDEIETISGDKNTEFSDTLFGTNRTWKKTEKITTKTGTANGFGMTLTEEQRGPNGGRIMWFPPYNLKFSEQTHTDWNQNNFIGRGEKIYSYVNTERSGTLSFTILVDHPSIINEWSRGGKQGKTANKVDPLSKDEMILRYFAGCDSLEFNPRGEYNVPYSITKKDTSIVSSELVEDKKTEKVPKMEKKEVQNDEPTMTFYSVFYYPNNYSAADFMGQKVSSANRTGTLANKLPKDQQEINFKKGLETMFETGKRSEGVGYERGNGENSTGMTYNNKCYIESPSKYYKDKGVRRKWYYPVDSRVMNEDLRNKDRYNDMHDFGLNSTFYGDFWSTDSLNSVPEGGMAEYLNNGNTSLEERQDPRLNEAKSLIQMSDVENKYIVPSYNFFKNLETVIQKFNSETNNQYTYQIEIQGFASSHGYSTESITGNSVTTDVVNGDINIESGARSNEILAENRAAVIEGWIRSLGIFDFDGNENKPANATISHNGNGHVEGTGGNDTESDFRPKAARAAVVTFKIIAPDSKITDVQTYEDVEKVEVRKVEEREDIHEEIASYDTSKSDDYENQTYDNEYTYFKQINENDDMIKRYLSDKVDYFDPAYHSITPEGFNARLTFLQQCTRQGPTISASDLKGSGAYGAGNLSFGRAPFCILRVGDFFNTKICINSINISYDTEGIRWDLNPEGIGLQPMMANVDIQFTFLGGSDISGPIARLQNAASFNYYANTSVYDRRSDYREGFVTPEDDTAKSWTPMVLKKDAGANITEHFDFYTRTPKEGSDGKIIKLTKD